MAKKSSDYWKKRAENERRWQLKQLRLDSRFNKVLDHSYQIAIDNINKQIEHELSRVGGVQNLVTAQQMAEYERLAQQVVAKAQAMRAAGKTVKYSDFSKDVNDRMKAYNATMRINQMELLKSEIGTHLLDLGIDVETKITDKVYSDYIAEMERQAGILGSTTKNPIWASTDVIDQTTASIAVGDFSKNVWANVDVLKARLDGLVATAMIRGDNPREMIKYLKPLVSKTVKDARYAAERIARTESARAQHKVQIESLKKAEYKYCKWYAEAGACKICDDIANSSGGSELPDGIYPVDDCPDVPVHPNCRCSVGAYWLEESKSNDRFTDIKSGESGAIKEEAQHIDEFKPLLKNEPKAKRLYLEFIQRSKTDSIRKIAKAGSLNLDDAERIYKHVFTEKHLTETSNGHKEYEYFDPNYSMAQSFQRIFNNQKLLDRDKILLKHELYERKLMEKNPNMTYFKAHKLTNKKYNYEELTKAGE